MKTYDGSNFTLPKSNEEYIAIWDDMNLGPFLPLEEQVENEVGAYVALRHKIIVTKDEDKRMELGKSLEEWLECQLRNVRKQVLGTVETDSVAVFEAMQLAPNAGQVSGLSAVNSRLVQRVLKAGRPKKALPGLGG